LSETFRNGQQSVLAVDTIALMDALQIGKAILGGFDWGARTADIIAALWRASIRIDLSRAASVTIWVLLQFPCEIYASYEAAVAASTRNSAALRAGRGDRLLRSSAVRSFLATSSQTQNKSVWFFAALWQKRCGMKDTKFFEQALELAAPWKVLEVNMDMTARGFRSFRNYRTRILFFCGKLTFFTAWKSPWKCRRAL
jgi:pimeloyl-ACP methyl ester carboxylesterase